MSTLDNLTIKEAREIAALFNNSQLTVKTGQLDDYAIGKHVIIRTYSAGVWFGVLDKKAGMEVILKDARRMWYWVAADSISLSGVAVHGIKQSDSRIAPAVDSVYLEAIEIIPTTEIATKSISEAKDAKAE